MQNINVVRKPKKQRSSASGTKLRCGRYYEEYLDKLATAEARFNIYDRMERSDYQISRMLRTIYAPIKSAKFEYKPVDTDDVEQKKQCDFKTKLFHTYGVDQWENILHQVLSFVKHGFAVFEPFAYQVNDPELGKVLMMKSLGLIRQSSIHEWDVRGAEVKRIKQVSSYSEESAGYISKWIDAANLFILTNQKEGDNFEGLSILRAVYGNYIRKDLYLRLDMIGIEKMAVGTPIAFVPEHMIKGEDSKDLEALEEALEKYIASESNYLILPKALQGGKDEHPGFMIQEGKYNSEAVQKAIQREDTKILDAILASFLDIGVYKSGGNSQNEGQMELFLNSLMSIARMCAYILDNIAHMYYVANFGVPSKRINTIISNLERNDVIKMMETIRGYVQCDVIRPDDRLEKEARADLGLPEKEDSTERNNVAQPDKNTFRTPDGEATPQNNPEKAKTNGE